MLKRRSFLERWVTLSVVRRSVASQQSIRSVGGQVPNLTTSYFEWKEMKFVGKKTTIYRRNLLLSSRCLTRSSLCLFFVYATNHTRKSTPWACLRRRQKYQARATAETAVIRCQRSTKEPITTNPLIAKVSSASCGYAPLNCPILLKYEFFQASARCQMGTGLIFSVKPVLNFAQRFPGHSLWACLHPRPWIFSQKRPIRTRSEN